MGAHHPAAAGNSTRLRVLPGGAKNGAPPFASPDTESWRHYPLWRVICRNGLTLGHYCLGCAVILVAYRAYPIVGWPVGLSYVAFAVAQRYLLMPLVVCPDCVYQSLAAARRASGLKTTPARLGPRLVPPAGSTERTSGALSRSSLNVWSLLLPVPLAAPGLALSPSTLALCLTASAAVLTVTHLTLSARVGQCSHCPARGWCPVRR